MAVSSVNRTDIGSRARERTHVFPELHSKALKRTGDPARLAVMTRPRSKFPASAKRYT